MLMEQPTYPKKNAKFDRSRTAEYTEELDKAIASIKAVTEEDRIHEFFECCRAVARRLFTSTRKNTPRSSAEVLKIKNDVHAINIALFHINENTHIPNKIKHRDIFKNCDMSRISLASLKTTAKSELNSKRRKRAALARRLYTNRRSDHFSNGRLGAFLCSALSKYSTFRGIESMYNTFTGAVTSKPQEVKDLATSRIRSTFYEQRIPEPAYIKHKDAAALALMPTWYKERSITSRRDASTLTSPKACAQSLMLNCGLHSRAWGRINRGDPPRSPQKCWYMLPQRLRRNSFYPS